MDDSLNKNTQSRINDLCKKISVAHTLDTEIQEELRGHMEDKLLAYLNRQEPLSEEDALLLVREHFGDPAQIKSLLQDVHIVETQVSFTRRLAAIVAVHLICMTTTSIIITVSGAFLSGYQFIGLDPVLIKSIFLPIMLATNVFVTFFYWRLLFHWEQKIRRGEQPWFQRWHTKKIVSLLGILVFILMVTPSLFIPRLQNIPAAIGAGFLFTVIAMIICTLWQAIVWLWWFDRPPRLSRTIIFAALIWLALTVTPWQNIHIVHFDIYSYDPMTSTPDQSNNVILWQEHKENISGIWALKVRTPNNHLQAIGVLDSLFTYLFVIAFAQLLYTLFHKRKDPPDKNFPTAKA